MSALAYFALLVERELRGRKTHFRSSYESLGIRKLR